MNKNKKKHHEKLQSHCTFKLSILGFIHNTHATLAELLEDFVM